MGRSCQLVCINRGAEGTVNTLTQTTNKATVITLHKKGPMKHTQWIIAA